MFALVGRQDGPQGAQVKERDANRNHRADNPRGGHEEAAGGRSARIGSRTADCRHCRSSTSVRPLLDSTPSGLSPGEKVGDCVCTRPPASAGLLGTLSGTLALEPDTVKMLVKSSPTYWRQPGMPIDPRSMPGLCCVLLKISAPTGVPLRMFEVTRLMVLPITGRADAANASADRSTLVWIGSAASRLTLPGSRAPLPGLQPVSAVWFCTEQ